MGEKMTGFTPQTAPTSTELLPKMPRETELLPTVASD